MNWHAQTIEAIFQQTGSSPEGLSSTLAAQRLQEAGPNVLAGKKKASPLLLFLRQFKDFMILVLAVAALIAGIAGDVSDAVIILVIVLLNAVVGFVQEYRAEQAMEALKKMAAPHTTALRDGHVHTVPAADLVPGDVVLLEAGNTVPADLRLFAVQSLKIMEAALTGESVAVDKTPAPLRGDDLHLADRLNMAYKGTQVTAGHGNGIVVATGMNTEMGRIARLLQEDEAATPLQQRMADFGKKLSYIILAICAVLFVVGLLRGEAALPMLLVSISLAVAAIPEALPALITIALSRGANRLVKKNMLIRKLTAVETLGSVSFICTDKTGTLTQNKMSVMQTVPFTTTIQPARNSSLLEVAMALNHTVLENENGLLGDPTETALVEYVQQKFSPAFYHELQEAFPREAEIPFDSERKCMTTVHRFDGRLLVITKGAAEALAQRASDGENTEFLLQEAGRLAASGSRVLAFGCKLVDEGTPLLDNGLESNLQLAGLVGLMDPPRAEVKDAIAECRRAGINVVMITGDHRETAAAVAQQIGLLREGDLVLTGTELQAMSPEEFQQKAEAVRVYARVSPEQKLAIVKALQARGQFVAMTGDGVNDAPSLRRANIGVAMGITGTDVSKEAAHTILLDDNFATIVKAVREGRRIYDNIRHFVKYIMTCNSAEIWTLFLAPLLGLPIPLQPVHILWINLVTDGLPGLALSAEKAERGIMQRPPRRPGESLFSESIGLHIAWVGLLMAGLTLATQAIAIGQGDAHWQTMVFTVLSLSQLAHVFGIRSDREFIFRKGVFSNRPLLWVIVFTIALQLAVIYLPAANRVFHTAPLKPGELFICFGVALFLFHAVEAEKWVRKQFEKKAA